MAAPMNSRIVLRRRPVGAPRPDDFELVESPVPRPADGEILCRTIYLSLDPYMRGRISGVKSYAKGVDPGDLMVGGTVGEVVESRHPGFAKGDLVAGYDGWQAYGLSKGVGVRTLDPAQAPISTALGVLGMPGMTAYVGLLDFGRPKPGETVVVSAASGAVGSAVGQIAKITGCRVVGVAGGRAKCDHVVNELGFDACVDYKAGDVSAGLAQACPNGVDVYFDNVGGAILSAVLRLVNPHARVPLCGLIPRNANAVHGLAHVFYEEGDSAGGVDFVSRWLPGYERAGSLHCHLTWHVALAELVRGDVARARVSFEDGIRARVAPEAPPANVLTDGASLLWRLFLDGEPVAPGEWREIADLARERFPGVAPHFHELHCAMAWAAAGEWELYERRLAELRDRAAKGMLPPGAAVPALAEGFGAFVRGDYAAAARVLEPFADDIVRVGGSHAQQDVFEETLVAAWIHAGEPAKAARALERRLARRPSPRAERWLTRATA